MLSTQVKHAEYDSSDAVQIIEPSIEAPSIPVYGSFTLADYEFALPAKSIQEVVNEPDTYSPVPLTPDYLLGVFNLRGIIVPVLDLRQIFMSSDLALNPTESRKVVILEHGHLCLGLLVDSTGEVFNSDDVEQCMFESRGVSAAEQVIGGVFKMDGGGRIVQILDVNGMLRLDNVPHSSNKSAVSSNNKRGARHQCITFTVGESCCALDIGEIREIVNIGSIENNMMAGGMCLGAIDIRGDTVPIVNFSALLGYKSLESNVISENDSQRVIVMSIQDNLIGLLTDSIENIVAYFDEDLVEFPILTDKKKNMFKGCVPASSNNKHTILLESSEILTSKELTDITRGHSKLFTDSSENAIRKKKDSLDRRTIITFSLEYRFGLDINDITEVINYPLELIHAPNMADHINGMVNLRGELVAVIDSRKMYGLDKAASEVESKVLIYQNSGEKQGLMVDSVDSIVSFCQADVAKVPGIVFKDYEGNMGQDVLDAVMVDIDDNKETLCILDLDAVSQRARG